MSLIVETATFPPGRCAVSGRSDGPFIDTGSDTVVPGRVYISTLVLQQLASEHLAMVASAPLEALREENDELRAQVEALEGFKEAVDTVFKKLDRRPPRRRAKKAEPEVAPEPESASLEGE